MKTAELCREHGISAEVSGARRQKAMEGENRRLKLLVAELSLHGQALKAVIPKKRMELPP